MATVSKNYFTTKASRIMNIFITGATGYIGNILALKLADSNNIIHALVRDPGKATNLAHPNIKLFKGDINDIDSIKRAMEGCEQVFHLASFARLDRERAEAQADLRCAPVRKFRKQLIAPTPGSSLRSVVQA